MLYVNHISIKPEKLRNHDVYDAHVTPTVAASKLRC